MATSLLGLDFEYFRGLLLAEYRTTPVYWPGSPFNEPDYTTAPAAPADWIVPVLFRSESNAFNVENAQKRMNRIVIYGAFQPGRGDFVARIDRMHADLFDALNLDRESDTQAFTDSFEFLGSTEGPGAGSAPDMDTSRPWIWRAWMTDFETYKQVA